MMQSKRMRYLGRVAGILELRKHKNFLIRRKITRARSVRRYRLTWEDNILIRPNKMQQYAGIYLLQNHSTCFGCPSHPSSGEHKTVTAASGTGHSI